MRGLPWGAAVVLAAVVFGWSGGVARGQTGSTFTILPEQTQYYVPPNQDLTVRFRLRETFTTTAFFDTNANQLVTFQVGVDRLTTTPAAATPAALTTANADTTVWDADTSTLPVLPDRAEPSGFTIGTAVPTNPGGNVRNVSLGNVTIHAGATQTATTNFQVNQTTEPDFLTNSSQNLDTFINTTGPTAFRVTVAQAGDATLDGRVDSGDFNLLATNFGLSGRVWQQGDFTGDGKVDSGDFNLLATNFGLTNPGLTLGLTADVTASDRAALAAFAQDVVPEPAAAGLFGLAAVGLLARRRGRGGRRTAR